MTDLHFLAFVNLKTLAIDAGQPIIETRTI